MMAFLVSAMLPTRVFAINASDRYRSPRNPERKIRSSTELIVLHTTEAAEHGSLVKLCDRGEAHFCVTEEGRVYRIVDRDREAFHAGRSMWNGREDVDKFSIGIECVGYHDKPMPMAQIEAIKTLVKELQSMYRLSDDKVVCHSHVAYGAPNRWHRQKHRGRKRCGMLFAMPSVRAQLGLKKRPAYDADVRAKRLVVGDDYLRKVLYGNIDTMKSSYKDKSRSADDKTGIFSWLKWRGSETKAPAKSATKTTAAKPAAKTAAKTATAAKPKATLHSVTPPQTKQELIMRGYKIKGSVSKDTTAAKIAGPKWNSPDTYYTIRDKVIPGNKIDPAHIEKGMFIWMR
ncbi:MAG: N-acetylmuramoyl-L-alanine amidase [Kiritimatiellae bacterium]|nr:N-acetylmuramoyl-L-alanine amidase [Kiritimatiellia bacterium]